MRVNKCDRCGKIYTGNDFNIRTRTDIVIADPSRRDRLLMKDLCSDCLESLNLWWKEPALAAITNDENL